MLYTSAEANKLLKRLKNELEFIRNNERHNCEYVKAIEEKDEDVRPEYDIIDTEKKISELNEKIRKVKHAINKFNVVTEVPGTGMTIDQVLVYMPQLSANEFIYSHMSEKMKKERLNTRSQFIEYNIANYDPAVAKELADKYSNELNTIQVSLDTLNNTLKEIEIDL